MSFNGDMLRKLHQDVSAIQKELDQLRSENERLRDALKAIEHIKCRCDGWSGPCGCGDKAQYISYDALHPTTDTPAVYSNSATINQGEKSYTSDDVRFALKQAFLDMPFGWGCTDHEAVRQFSHQFSDALLSCYEWKSKGEFDHALATFKKALFEED